MKSLDETVIESVVTAMDGEEKEIFPFIPYLLQDLWEMGASPEAIIELIYKNRNDHTKLKILDLGCGKGAVTIKIAEKFNCKCLGIDAVEEFVKEAQEKAEEHSVNDLCRFEVGDIRKRVHDLSNFDIIILGAIGPVFGDYYTTLSKLSNCLKKDGIFIIDDAYLPEHSEINLPHLNKKSEILQQISNAGLHLITEIVFSQKDIRKSNQHISSHLRKRVRELQKKHPAKKSLFKRYLKKQEEENDILEKSVLCSTMLIGKF